jgi:hypothetical protein
MQETIILPVESPAETRARLLFAGIQLVAENYENVILDRTVSGTNKMVINNLGRQCDRLVAQLHSNLGPESEKEFWKLVSIVEEYYCSVEK